MQRTPRSVFWLLTWLLLGAPVGWAVGADGSPDQPHPVLVWPAGPFEVRVSFNQPLDGSVARMAVGRVIPFKEETSGDPPAEPDRKRTDSAHRGTLRIAAARLDEGGRSLHLVTDPHPRDADYSLHLAGIRGRAQPASGEAIDLRYDLEGVEAVWDEGKDDGSEPLWSGWWPDLDPAVVQRLTRGSVEHERSLALLSRPGRLVLSTLLVLQEGRFTLRLVSNAPIEASVGGENAAFVDEPEGGHRAEIPVVSSGEPIDLTLTLRTGAGTKPTALRAALIREGESREYPITNDQLLLPWASAAPTTPVESPVLPRAMAGGDPSRGESVFFSEQARCSACHAIDGKGGKVGPDLGHQYERSLAQVYRDLADPGASINPDYVAYTVALKDGRVLVGIVRAEGADAIRVTDTDAKTTLVRRDEIEEFRPCPTSIMPVGLAGTLGDGPMRDLLAFLTRAPGAAR
jgi:putative heme-binding domain-containing protein